MGGEGDGEAIQRQIAVGSFGDPPGAGAFAEAARGRRGELARAAVVAVARLEKVGFEGPFGLRRSHGQTFGASPGKGNAQTLAARSLGFQLRDWGTANGREFLPA